MTTKVAVWPFVYRPTPGKFGEAPAYESVVIGAGGISVGDTATTSYYLGVPDRYAMVRKMNITGKTAALSSGGTVKAQLIRHTSSAASPADVNLTASTSIEADVITAEGTFNWSITASDTNATLIPAIGTALGDTLRIDVVASAAVGTQPVLVATVEYSIIN